MKHSKTLKAEERQKGSCHRPADRNNPKPYYKPQRQNRGIAKTIHATDQLKGHMNMTKLYLSPGIQ